MLRTLLLLLMPAMVWAQDYQLGVNLQSGWMAHKNHGYYLSTSIELPVVKGFSVTPRFGYASSLPNTFMGLTKSPGGITNSHPIDGPRQANEGGSQITYVAMLLTLKPLDWLAPISRHELRLSTGLMWYGYTNYNASYDMQADGQPLTFFSMKSYTGAAPYFFNLGYQYHFYPHFTVGAELGITGVDGDGMAYSGVRLGIHL